MYINHLCKYYLIQVSIHPERAFINEKYKPTDNGDRILIIYSPDLWVHSLIQQCIILLRAQSIMPDHESSNLGCSCVNLKKLFNLSVLYFVHLIGRDKDSTYSIEICDH